MLILFLSPLPGNILRPESPGRCGSARKNPIGWFERDRVTADAQARGHL